MFVSQIRKKKQLMIDMEMKTTNKDIDKILMILTLRIYSIFFFDGGSNDIFGNMGGGGFKF